MDSSKLQINEVAGILDQHLSWNKARMDCFVGMLIGLLNNNLVEIPPGFSSDVLQESRYRRFQLFIHGHFLSFGKATWFIMALFGFLDIPFYLEMDCTKLAIGQEKPEYAYASSGVQGIAIPVY